MTRPHRKPRTIILLLGITLTFHPNVSRGQATPPPQNIEDALHQMSDLAGVIFIGEVTAIRHKTGQQGASGIVEVDFIIEQAIRGCTAGAPYTSANGPGFGTQAMSVIASASVSS